MKDIVVIRPLLAAYIYTQCPLCNTMNYLDKTGTFYDKAKDRCEGCGARIDLELVAIQDARFLINSDDLKDDDITALLAQSPNDDNLVISNPVKKITIEKSAFYTALVCCPFCEEYSISRYDQMVQPYVAQWCPECGAELVVTIIVHGVIAGDVSDWYQPRVEEFYRPEGDETE